MFGLRQKLLMGFGGLLAILLIVSGMGIAVMHQHRTELDKFLSENWNSVQYGQSMLDAVQRLNDTAKPLENAAPTAAALAQAEADMRQPIQEFDTNLALENGNITLPGEAELAQGVTDLWQGTSPSASSGASASGYRDALLTLLNNHTTAAQRAAATATVLGNGPQLKKGAQGVVDLNLQNMTPVEGRIKLMADRTTRLMLLLSAIGVALAAVFTIVVARSMLQPLQALTRSAREIEQGNLDLVVQVRSRDELAQLAEAFNSMAAKLREFRRTDRAKLARTQETTRNAINSLTDAVAIVSPAGEIEMANAAGQRLFSLRAGQSISEMNADWLKKLFEQTKAELRPVEPSDYGSAMQVLDENGGEKFFLPHAVPILDAEGALSGVTVVLADVTNLRRLDEMKSGMLSVVSHELKTPLTSIRMGVHLMLEERLGSLTRQQQDILTAVREDSDRLHRIVENLLDMSRIEAGRQLMDLKPEPVDKLLEAATQPIAAAFKDKGVLLNVTEAIDLPPVIADATRIGYVFSNLLGNALKYTPPGGQVRVSAQVESDDHVRFTVADTGPGVPRQYQEKIFERFFRVPGQSSITGAGLGLAIARDIVDVHGGRIWLESDENAGSKFNFTLRRASELAGHLRVQHTNGPANNSEETVSA